MRQLILTFVVVVLGFARPALAQDAAWVQIEAHPSLNLAEDRVRVYANAMPDVNGFSLGGGWYAVVLGPYSPEDAETVLRGYRNEGRVPRDSFIAYTASFRQQFWPVGANALNVTPLSTPLPSSQAAEVAAPTPAEPELEPSDETPREARRSEAKLSRDERKELQIMLKASGHYTSNIDGAFGRGTRNSMAHWQTDNGFEPTGILTTLQRAALYKQYNAVLDGLGFELVRDAQSGIEMRLPTAAVAFDKYEPPFVHFENTGSIPHAKVLLISQEGDQNTLFGLYDIMQTLEIVPLDGTRERRKDSFLLIGENSDFISHTEAKLVRGQVKGFTLIWPAGDEARRTRLLAEMQKSFTRLEGVLDPTAGMNEEQRIDLVAGLKIRTPKLSRSGFYVAGNGTTLTNLAAVDSCERITIDGDYDAQIIATDAELGLAVLRPDEALAPAEFANFRSGATRLKSDIAVAGYPFEGALSAPTLTFGSVADVRGLQGETELNRLNIDAMAGDEGGPVLDGAGAVVGIMSAPKAGGRKLPAGVGFSVSADAAMDMLSQSGITAALAGGGNALPVEDLSAKASAMTVLVSCWE